MAGARILVVDDDRSLAELLTVVLRRGGHLVEVVSDGEEAVGAALAGHLDLVVLDIDLGGGGDGRVVLSRLREETELPVIMISGHGSTEDRVLGLRLGADDYLAKPFSPVELEARVASVLRRARAAPTPAPAAGVIELDESTHEVRVRGRHVRLTAREFDLLAFLVGAPRQVFSRAQLLERVWGSSAEWQDASTVTEHVRRLRRKVEPDPENPRWLHTVRGVGYKFEP